MDPLDTEIDRDGFRDAAVSPDELFDHVACFLTVLSK
jgi:hypothetical protein